MSVTLQAAHSATAALHRNPGAITIRDASEDAEEAAAPATAADKQMQADADYARQMQAKLDAAQARGGGRWAKQLLQCAAFHSLHTNVFSIFEATAAAGWTCSLLQAVTGGIGLNTFCMSYGNMAGNVLISA